MDFIKKCLFILIAFVQFSFVLPQHWENDVINGIHFNHLVLKANDIHKEGNQLVDTPALIVVYSSSCKDTLQSIGITEEKLPPAKYLVIARYNHEIREYGSWYKLDAKEDFRRRYEYGDECPDISFLPANGDLRYAVPMFEDIAHFDDWIWRRFAVTVTFVNKLPFATRVHSDGNGPLVKPVDILSNEEGSIKTYVSYKVYAQSIAPGKVIFGDWIDVKNEKAITIVLSSSNMQLNVEKIVKERKAMLDQQSDRIRKWRRDLAFMFAQNFKQHVIIPKLTTKGYEIISLPYELKHHLIALYKQNKTQMSYIKENNLMFEPWINTRDAKIGVMSLADTARREIMKEIQPLAEQWSGVRLQNTDTVLIELTQGGFIRPHVGNVSKHVISVLIPISLISNSPLELEVRDFYGDTQELELTPGQDVLLFEGSTVTTAMPHPLRESPLVLCYVHFKPLKHWTWFSNGESISDGSKSEYVFAANSVFAEGDVSQQVFRRWTPHRHEDL